MNFSWNILPIIFSWCPVELTRAESEESGASCFAWNGPHTAEVWKCLCFGITTSKIIGLFIFHRGCTYMKIIVSFQKNSKIQLCLTGRTWEISCTCNGLLCKKKIWSQIKIRLKKKLWSFLRNYIIYRQQLEIYPKEWALIYARCINLCYPMLSPIIPWGG